MPTHPAAVPPIGRFLALVLALCAGGLSEAADFRASDHGAIGDGVADDGPALRKAVQAAVVAGPGSRVILDAPTYRLDRFKGGGHQISIADAQDLRIEGRGAVLINDPHNGLLSLKGCRGVVVQGLVLDYAAPTFTQGTIVTVDPAAGRFDLRIQAGYRHPVDEYERLGIKPPSRDWGVVHDPVARHRRWDVLMHIFMKGFARSPAAPDLCRVTVVDEARGELARIRPGDRYVITFKYGNAGANVDVQGCADCVLEDVTVHMAKYGMTFAVGGSTGRNTFRRVRIAFKPGSDHLIVTPKDGFHCKANRVGPLFEDCFFEGLLDDSINISACPYWLKAIIAPGVYAMNGRPAVGDRLTAYTPAANRMIAGFTVTAVEPHAGNPRWSRVTLDCAIPDAVPNTTGDDFPGGNEKMGYTGMYNLDACGAGYIIRNCTFREQRRHAMLVRAPGGLIEGNTVDGVGGGAVYMANEVGSYYEGPVPRDAVIRNNVFRNTQDVPVVVRSTATRPEAYAENIRITGNTITGTRAGCVRAVAVRGLVVTGNTLTLPDTVPAGTQAWSLTRVLEATLEGNTTAVR